MKKANNSTSVRIAAFVMILFFTVVFLASQLRKNELESYIVTLQEEIDAVSQSIHALNAEINRPFDDEYVAEVAQEQLGLCFPQEIIFIGGDSN